MNRHLMRVIAAPSLFALCLPLAALAQGSAQVSAQVSGSSAPDPGSAVHRIVPIVLDVATATPVARRGTAQVAENPALPDLDNAFEVDTWQASGSFPVPAQPRTALLWYPPERGFSGKVSGIAKQVAEITGMDVWLMDIHRAQFLPTTAQAMLAWPPSQVEAMIDWMLKENGSQSLLLVAEQRSAQPVLKGIARWQRNHPHDTRLGGVILISPNLYQKREAGGQRVFAGIADQVTLPVFVIQPLLASQRWYAADIQQRLGQHGNPVMLRLVKGVRDGWWRNDFDPTPFELQRSRSFAREFLTARRFFNRHQGELAISGGDAPVVRQSERREVGDGASVHVGLSAFRKPRAAPRLQLSDLDGEPIRLSDLRGQVVLVNFWASWCPPCVKEMPSMSRLQARYRAQGLHVVAVDVDESVATVKAFVERLPVELTIALDSGARAMRRWKVFSFPSSFLVDRQGRLRYGLSGAVDWDDKEVSEVVTRLLHEPDSRAEALSPALVSE